MFFPYKSLKISTSESLNQVVTVLKNNTSEKSLFSLLKRHRSYFEGDVSDIGFKINRVIRYRNSFKPVIIGSYEKNENKVLIKIRMRLKLVVIAFGIVWFSGVFIVFIAFMPDILSIRSINKETISLFIPFFMLVFGYLLFTIPFIIESKLAADKIIELVNGENEN